MGGFAEHVFLLWLNAMPDAPFHLLYQLSGPFGGHGEWWGRNTGGLPLNELQVAPAGSADVMLDELWR